GADQGAIAWRDVAADQGQGLLDIGNRDLLARIQTIDVPCRRHVENNGMLQDRRDVCRAELAEAVARFDLGDLEAAVQTSIAGEMAERIDMGSGVSRRYDDLIGK